jgi:micrococcal nuclease
MKPVIIIAIAFVLLIPPMNYSYAEEKIPDWVRNVFLWYGQGEISEDELLRVIQFLVDVGILSFDEVIKEQKESTASQPSYPSHDCSGNARCITGTVTSVIDGDTIKVDGQSIRFALASAPEPNEFGGDTARNFIEEICPVGSTATVDEDDGQTEGSYGRIVGVIYCNGVNLNEELVDSGLGYLSTGFCDGSEFATENWAQKYGCSTSSVSEYLENGCHRDYPYLWSDGLCYTLPEIIYNEPEYVPSCDSSYPDVCIAPYPPDLDCGEIPYTDFRVLQPDPHGFDVDNNGIGCESPEPEYVPSCDSSYPDVCIAPYPPDLDCGEIPYTDFRVLQPDPHGFDVDNNGIGCESPEPPSQSSTEPTQTQSDCDPSYPDFCIPSPPPDLNCGDIPQKRFTVLQPDPHRFDGDKNGIGCES